MTKPIILAICGKSATGKTVLAKRLIEELNGMQVPANLIISDTTRPPREREIYGVDYNFLSLGNFLNRKEKNIYLEDSYFRNWRYGTPRTAIDKDKINIGIFNAKGIKSLQKEIYHYNIIPIYLEEKLTERLRRSYQREGCGKIEYFRRALTDGKDFFRFDKELKKFYYGLKFSNGSIIVFKSQAICAYLKSIDLIEFGQNFII